MVILLNNTIQEIFAFGTDEFLEKYSPSYQQIKVLNHINACKTPDMGAAVYDCECGKKTFVFHSCRDRHCPVCQGMNNKRWADKQMESSLPVKYWHLVFTVPDLLNELMMANPEVAYDALFEASADAVLELSAGEKSMNATPGFTSVLHTWGQTMQYHPHIHMILTAGGLSLGGNMFIDKSDKKFLFPYLVLSRLFRGKFLAIITKKINIAPKLLSELYATDFSCHLEETVSGIGNVIKYLARYINRVCISESRIINFDEDNGSVTFSYKDNKDGKKKKEMTICVSEFIRRYLMHVLPKRFMKIRHYGILNNHDKFKRIRLCRRLLHKAVKYTVDTNKYIPVCSKCKRKLPEPIHLSAEHFIRSIKLTC